VSKATETDADLGQSDLVDGILDVVIDDADQHKDPVVILHALGRVACETALPFKVPIDDALIEVARAANALETECRVVVGDDSAAPRALREVP
jgi:hypothetical protein